MMPRSMCSFITGRVGHPVLRHNQNGAINAAPIRLRSTVAV